MPARQMHTVEQITAGSATFLYSAIWNTLAELATIRPPADRPTKSMKQVIYRPHDTPLFIPVTPRPLISW